MDRILLGAILFMGLLALFTSELFSSSTLISSTNTSYTLFNTSNLTISSTSSSSIVSLPPFPVCNFKTTQDANLLDVFISSIVDGSFCIANSLWWFVQLMFTKSDFQFLAILFFAIGAVILYRILRLIKPFGN